MPTLSELVRAQLEQDPWWQLLQQQKGGPAGGKPAAPAGGVVAPTFGPQTEDEIPFFRTDKDMELAARLRATAGVARAGGIKGVGAGHAASLAAGAKSHKGANLHYIKGTNRYVAGDGTVFRRDRRGQLVPLGARF